MIKFFNKILIFLFEKITPSSAFHANGLSDSVHTIKKKVRMLWFYCVKPINKVIPCVILGTFFDLKSKLLFKGYKGYKGYAVRSNLPLLTKTTFEKKKVRHQASVILRIKNICFSWYFLRF